MVHQNPIGNLLFSHIENRLGAACSYILRKKGGGQLQCDDDDAADGDTKLSSLEAWRGATEQVQKKKKFLNYTLMSFSNESTDFGSKMNRSIFTSATKFNY